MENTTQTAGLKVVLSNSGKVVLGGFGQSFSLTAEQAQAIAAQLLAVASQVK